MFLLVYLALGACAGVLAGLLGIGGGLLLSGMADPANVLAFLDVGGDWNPALAFTMGGAVLTAAPAYYLVRRLGRTAQGDPVTLPDRFRIDRPLLGGAAVFGLGWGMSGICPGPGLLLLAGASAQSIVFVVALATGIVVARS